MVYCWLVNAKFCFYICKVSLYLELVCFHIVKWFHVLLLNISNSTYQVFLCNTNNLPTAVWFEIMISIF